MFFVLKWHKTADSHASSQKFLRVVRVIVSLAILLSLSQIKPFSIPVAAAAKSLHSCPTVRPQTAAHQAPLSLGFSRQGHWSGLPFPSPMHQSEKWKWSRYGLLVISVNSFTLLVYRLYPHFIIVPLALSGAECHSGSHFDECFKHRELLRAYWCRWWGSGQAIPKYGTLAQRRS